MIIKRATLTQLILLLAVVLLSACATTGFNSQAYTVKSGDTLYFIAWKYKLDHKTLARWNNIPPPYTIFPGDKLLIYPGPGQSASSSESKKASRPPSRSNASVHTVKKGDTLYGIASRYSVSAKTIARINNLRSPYVIYPGQRLKLKGSATAVAANKPRTPIVKKPPPRARVPALPGAGLPDPNKWKWPTRGKVIRKFKGSKSIQQGIDISGKKGQSIIASAPGEVVYSGDGLASYGQLIIIKHSDNYLSAYGYNSQLLVKEGTKVKAGQPIAHMGGSNGQSQLHFEIRKHGTPVDPLRYLPGSG